jgi:outer membrane receptor for ferrienterochelin and colicin
MSRFVAFLATALFVLAGNAPIRAADTGTVRGTIADGSAALDRIAVQLSGDRFTTSTTTDRTGRFTFSGIPFGHYTVTATVDGVAEVAPVDVTSGAVITVALNPAQNIGRVAGSSRTAHGTPVSENTLTQSQIAALPQNDSLDQIVETVPGIARFSYNEPVAHGFHGLTYELDGAPLPQSTTSNFSEIVDPRTIQAVEVFTGSIPAEYGGSRMGAVVNLISRPPDASQAPQGFFSAGAGSYGGADARFNESFSVGSAAVSFSANESRTNRGLDSPTPDSELSHDASNLSDQFLRVVTPLGSGNRLAFDFGNQFSTFQIPINTNPDDPNNSFVSVPGTDDTQLEYDRYASLSLTHTSKDGLGQWQVTPWLDYSRVSYDGDIAKDLLATVPDPDTGVDYQNGLNDDRRATTLGLRASYARTSDIHAFKAGIDASHEQFSDIGFIALSPASGLCGGTVSCFDSTDVVQAGAQFAAYAQDRWALGQRFALNYGLRFDHSTGFVGGAQLSPRVELNYSPDRATVLHAYAGRFYAAPSLEDTRRDAILTQSNCDAPPCADTALPPYDLQPERDSYFEFGVAHTFAPGYSMYVNAWKRNVVNVLDTTQLLNTPLFAVYNNAVGIAHGLEYRLVRNTPVDQLFLSASLSQSVAGGISGGTFLFAPSDVSDTSLEPEDHDQALAVNVGYTRRFTADHSYYVNFSPQYGTGYPVEFQNGTGRLPTHVILNGTLGREAAKTKGRLGFQLSGENLLNHQYLIKVNNGFNTTQWFTGRRVMVRLTTAF